MEKNWTYAYQKPLVLLLFSPRAGYKSACLRDQSRKLSSCHHKNIKIILSFLKIKKKPEKWMSISRANEKKKLVFIRKKKLLLLAPSISNKLAIENRWKTKWDQKSQTDHLSTSPKPIDSHPQIGVSNFYIAKHAWELAKFCIKTQFNCRLSSSSWLVMYMKKKSMRIASIAKEKLSILLAMYCFFFFLRLKVYRTVKTRRKVFIMKVTTCTQEPENVAMPNTYSDNLQNTKNALSFIH